TVWASAGDMAATAHRETRRPRRIGAIGNLLGFLPVIDYGRCQGNHGRLVRVNRTGPVPSPLAGEGGLAPANSIAHELHRADKKRIGPGKNGGGNVMTTRRHFLKGAGAAGLAFCGCSMQSKAHAQEGGRRLPVMVGDRRVKTIDVHAHCLFQDAVNLMGDQARNVFVPVNGAQNQYIAIAERLKQMDAMAIDMEVLSINPFWYRKDRDTAAAIVRMQNDKLAELCAAHPDRFAAFASLALQFPDLAVEQLEYAVKKLGLRGAQIGG